MNTSHSNKSPSQQQQQQQQGSQPTTVHSTHSSLETFDQATREQQASQQSTDDLNLDDKTLSSKDAKQGIDLEQANSAVQLDRDMQQSRRMSDADRQKASGNARSGSWSGNQSELPYIE
ncbi:hypothetical protein BGZ54_001147 [Gamsiella multidivaricata]|nr:hypothetical protein BGZ54_001147 [Gamsiella multidivaricata]